MKSPALRNTMAMEAARGNIIVKSSKQPPDPKDILLMEQWLNGEVAEQAFSKFGLGIRVHLTEVEPPSKELATEFTDKKG